MVVHNVADYWADVLHASLFASFEYVRKST
jgi:hypothetical protein